MKQFTRKSLVLDADLPPNYLFASDEQDNKENKLSQDSRRNKIISPEQIGFRTKQSSK